jgi:hypothetical protein
MKVYFNERSELTVQTECFAEKAVLCGWIGENLRELHDGGFEIKKINFILEEKPDGIPARRRSPGVPFLQAKP